MMPHERRHDTERLLGQVTMLTIVVVVAGLAAAAGGVTPAANHAGHGPGPSAQNVTTPCDGIDLDAVRRYKPNSRTDGHVEFPAGSLSFPVPASLPVTTGASGHGKTKFKFSLRGGTPTTCVYRGNGTNAYDFVTCKEAPLPNIDADDDDGDHDDGPGDPVPVAGTIVTADSFTLRVNRGDKTAGSTTVHLRLDGPTVFVLPSQAPIANGQVFTNANGSHSTYSTRDGAFLDTGNAFFQPLGTNGRACVSCHQVEDAMGLSAARVRARFENSCGLEPLFRPVDGSNNPTDDVSTMEARRGAYSLLLSKGLIRVQLAVPATAQFEVIAVDDPYGNSSGQPLPLTQISVFRRPLPATNLKFLGAISAATPPSVAVTPAIMWDGREIQGNPFIGLMTQANNATLIHAEAGASLSPELLMSIVDFALSLFTSQETETAAGSVSIDGASGGSLSLDGPVHDWRESRAQPDQAGRLPRVRCLGGPDRTTRRYRTRPGPVQLQGGRQSSVGDVRRQCSQRLRTRRAARRAGHDLHAVPLYVRSRRQRWRRLWQQHRERDRKFHVGRARGGIPYSGPAALHAPAEGIPERDPDDDRSRARADHGAVGRREQIQGPVPPRSRGTRAVLPQWIGRDARRRHRRLSSGGVSVQLHPAGES